jgi:spore coat polysaccharide biosynthesis protein SpsF (cytidylyltransferase family)
MKPAKPQPVPEIIRAAIERVTGDPYLARREIVQAIIDDLAAAGYAITRGQEPANPPIGQP